MHMYRSWTVVFACCVSLIGCGGGSGNSSSLLPVERPLTGNPGDTMLDDRFTSDTISNSQPTGNWRRRHVQEGTDAQYTQLDVNLSTANTLTLVPALTPGWFNNADAPLLYQPIGGDFSIETFVRASTTVNPTLPPTRDFNSAGLMARNPAGASGTENYVMVNVGRQDDRITAGVGSEVKSTINGVSSLELVAGSHSGRLVLCRTGELFRAWRWLDGDTGWSLLAQQNRADLPVQLQVGIVANAFNGPDLLAQFDYVVIRRPLNDNDCLPGV